MPMIYFQKLTEQGTRSEGTLKNLDEDCKRCYSCHRLQKIQTFASHFSLKIIVFTHENN